MKKIKYIVLLLFVSGLLSSCDSFLNVVPDNVATIDNAFTDKYNAEKYLFTCYSYLPNFADPYSNPALATGGDFWYADNHRWDSQMRLVRGEQSISGPLFNYWSYPIFIGIRDCNTFIEKVQGVRDLNDYEKKQWIAEAIFLKAYYHYYLTRMYGPIPLMDESVPVSAQTTSIKVTREPVDTCFAYVVRTLDKAIANLPEELPNPLTNLGRITKPIAMAVKAEVLMTAASPLFNGNQIHSTLKNKDGKLLFNPTFDPKKWEVAALACKEAIEEAEKMNSGLYQPSDVMSPYQMNPTTKHIAALRGAVTDPWNKEIIWGSTQSTGTLQFNSSPRWYTYIGNAAGASHSPTLRTAEEFYTKNGVPINEDKNWKYDDRFKLRTATAEEWLFVEPGQETAVLNFDRELRYYADLSFDRGAWFGNGSPNTPEEKPWYIRNRKGEFASIFEISQYSVTGLYPKKVVNRNNEVRDGNSYYSYNYSFPVIRLADLYLYYAEALNEVKSAPDAEVYEYIDKVRERAGLEGVVDSWSKYSKLPDKPSTKTGMREIIQRERLIELAYEGHRFWDLRRWMLAKKYMNAPVQGWNVQKNNALEYYRVTTYFNQTFSERDYFWPIPEDEIVKNPNLVQNVGW